jgi:hypothetical protein
MYGHSSSLSEDLILTGRISRRVTIVSGLCVRTPNQTQKISELDDVARLCLGLASALNAASLFVEYFKLGIPLHPASSEPFRAPV